MNWDMVEKYNEEKNIWQVQVTGEVDIFNSNQLKERLNELCSKKQCNLVIECGNLSYIDSTGLGALVSVLKTVKAYNGLVTLVNLRQNLLKLFKITNLDKVFHIEGDLNE